VLIEGTVVLKPEKTEWDKQGDIAENISDAAACKYR
jgi:hypothetical protein